MEKMRIPDKIKVGYQNRHDTYTGKLAYVIYYDEKNKLRKETSWQGWRDDKINPDDFDNVPTEGFVLNKGVGGARQSWGWNPRNEYIRVFDPRGFEFEISVANLLFILQECTSIKGKGLEGEFVYAWDGKDLVLLPVGCYEYKQSSEFTANKSKKVTKADMIAGRTYLDKNGVKLIYIGREKCRPDNTFKFGRYDSDEGTKYDFFASEFIDHPQKFYHVFYNLSHNNFEFHRGFTKLALVVDENTHTDFLSYHESFTKSAHVGKIEKGVLTTFEPPNGRLSHFKGVIKHGDNWYVGSIDRSSRHCKETNSHKTFYRIREKDVTKILPPSMECIDNIGVWTESMFHKGEHSSHYYHHHLRNPAIVEFQDVDEVELYTIYLHLNNGQTLQTRNHGGY